MKIFFTLIVCLFIYSPAQSQDWLRNFKLQSYKIPSRPVYFKYFDEEKRIIYLDFKEGLSVPCSDNRETTAEDSTTTKNLVEFFDGKQWQLADSIKPDLVYILANQNIGNWTEMITIQRIDAQGQKAQTLYDDLVKIREGKCPGKSKFEIIESAKNSLIYQVSGEQCAKFEPQTALALIITPPKLTIGQYTIWRIEYTINEPNRFDKFTHGIIGWFKTIALLTGKGLKEYTE